jgi:hypothetical protein
VAADAEHYDQTKYAALSTIYNSVPVAIETFGAFGDEVSNTLADAYWLQHTSRDLPNSFTSG